MRTLRPDDQDHKGSHRIGQLVCWQWSSICDRESKWVLARWPGCAHALERSPQSLSDHRTTTALNRGAAEPLLCCFRVDRPLVRMAESWASWKTSLERALADCVHCACSDIRETIFQKLSDSQLPQKNITAASLCQSKNCKNNCENKIIFKVKVTMPAPLSWVMIQRAKQATVKLCRDTADPKLMLSSARNQDIEKWNCDIERSG